MSVIGFRCFTNGFSFVVLQGTQQNPQVIENNRFSFPRDKSWCGKLAWVRLQVLELLRQHGITSAGIKKPEPFAPRKSLERSEVEGVIKETVYSFLGFDCKGRIKSQLRRDIEGFTQHARYLGQVLESRGLGELNNDTYKEATLSAIAELPSQE